MTAIKKVYVTVQLDPLTVLALDAIVSHLGRDRSAVVSEALAVYFAAIPRPGEPGATP